jgi:hypothetical protein
MNQALAQTLPMQPQVRALLDLIEADRARQCGQILGQAKRGADAARAQAHAEARIRLRRAFEEQRQRCGQQLAAAQAQLATRRRLHAQQRTAALLRLAWQQLPAELLALWREPNSRAAWVTQVLEFARARLPGGSWEIVHAPEWSEAQQKTLLAGLSLAPTLRADARISAGLKVLSHGNVLDATLDGLLADRAEFEVRLLPRLEALA